MAVVTARVSGRGADPRRGAALFIVLLFSSFLAVLAAAAMRTSLSGVRAAAVFADGIRADELGRSAADALAYHLVTGGDAAKRGGAIAVRLPGADITVDYLSESARVDVNLAPVPLIGALLSAAGADAGEAEAVMARITRSRKEAASHTEAGASTPDGAPPVAGFAALRASLDALGPASKTQQTAPETSGIKDTSELTRAWGLSDTLARSVLPSLTVSNGTQTVDSILAGRPVLLALLGGDERADDYLQRRRQGFVDKESALELLPLPSRHFVTFKDSRAVRAVVRVRLANGFERRYEIILAPPTRPGQGGQPPAPAPGGDAAAVPVVVSWRKLP